MSKLISLLARQNAQIWETSFDEINLEMILSMERDPIFDDFELVPEKIWFRVYDPSNLFTNTQREVETKINTSYILLHKHIWVSISKK